MISHVRIAVGSEAVAAIRPSWEALQQHPNSDYEHYSLVCCLRPEVLSPWALSLWNEGRCRTLVTGRMESAVYHPRIGYARLPGITARELVVLHEGILGEVDDGASECIVRAWTQALARGEADTVTIHHLPERHAGLWKALRRETGRTLGAAQPLWTFHRALNLESEPGFLLRNMRSKHRSWVKRKERELEEAFPGKVSWTWLKGLEDLCGLCEKLDEVARTTYQRGLGAGFINNDETRQRLALFAGRNQMRACVLECNGVPKAFWLGLLYRGVFHSSATGYTPDIRPFEAGTLMFLRMVDELVIEGASRLDFGLGDAEYKERFADDSWREATVQLFGSTGKGRLLRAYLGTTNSIDAKARDLASRMGILGRVKQAWRRHLKK